MTRAYRIERRPVLYPISASLAYVQLTRDMYALVDADDAHRLTRCSWRAKSDGNKFYAAGSQRIDGKRYYPLMHRYILGCTQDVDHINGNGLDNRRANLRPCANYENQWNTTLSVKNNTGTRGVRKTKYGTFLVRVSHMGKRLCLGTYATFEEAQAIAMAKQRELHGEFYRSASQEAL